MAQSLGRGGAFACPAFGLDKTFMQQFSFALRCDRQHVTKTIANGGGTSAVSHSQCSETCPDTVDRSLRSLVTTPALLHLFSDFVVANVQQKGNNNDDNCILLWLPCVGSNLEMWC